MCYVGSDDLDLGVQCSHHDRLAIGEAVTCGLSEASVTVP